jgi:diaminopimelate epimerase
LAPIDSDPPLEHPAPFFGVDIQTGAGLKTLTLRERAGRRMTFEAAMGAPERVREVGLPAGGEHVTATVLTMGNPQCVVLGPLPDRDSFERLGAALARHEWFPAGTNVEFAEVEAPDRIRILIWERGVGPTRSSGTGSCAALVAAVARGQAGSVAEVIAPGGSQRVEWRPDGVYLTGWAELICEGIWLE